MPSNRLLALLSSAAILGGCATSTPALAHFPHGLAPGNSTNCPRGINLGDGCAAAVATADFKDSSWPADALEGGRTWPNAHPWPWNTPGVDYPVGYDTSLTLNDPTVPGTIPGCAFSLGRNIATGYVNAVGGPATPTPNTSPAPELVCVNHAGLSIVGYDFSASPTYVVGDVESATHHDCIWLEIYNSVTGTIDIENNKFTECYSDNVVNGTQIIMLSGANSRNVTVSHNSFYGQGRSLPFGMEASIVDNATTDSITSQYNYFKDIQQRVMECNPASVKWTNNVVWGFNESNGYGGNGEHGETLLCFPPNMEVNYNLNVNPGVQTITTANYYFSDGQYIATPSQNHQLDHNVVVSNLQTGNAASIAGTVTKATGSYPIVTVNSLTGTVYGGEDLSGTATETLSGGGTATITLTLSLDGFGQNNTTTGSGGTGTYQASNYVYPAGVTSIAFTALAHVQNASVSALFTELSYDLFTNVTLTNNWGDPAGAAYCFQNIGGSSGGVNATQSGTALNITAVGSGTLYGGGAFPSNLTKGPTTTNIISGFTGADGVVVSSLIPTSAHFPYTATASNSQTATFTGAGSSVSPISNSLTFTGNNSLTSAGLMTNGFNFASGGTGCQ